MLREELNQGRLEGRQEIQTNPKEAETKFVVLRKLLGLSKPNATYDRGLREGGIDGYSKYSLNLQTKTNDDRLAYEKICKEKVPAIYDQQIAMARYQNDLIETIRRIRDLEPEVTPAV